MNLQPVLLSLVEVQNNHNSQAYAVCFTEQLLYRMKGNPPGKSRDQEVDRESCDP